MLSRWAPAGPVVVGLVAAAPLARVPFFASDDGLIHLWRLWEYARVASAAGYPPRWAPDAAYGFGAPLFTFYNPLAYALGVIPVSLGASAADASRLVFALSLVLSASGAYALGAAWNMRHARSAGLCAALLYTLAPYRLATVYERGALAEALGLAVAPWVVLAALRAAEAATVPPFFRLPLKGATPPSSPRPLGRRDGEAPSLRCERAAVLALAVGALIVAHTIVALLTLPFAAALGVARLFELPRARRVPGLVMLSVGLALGVAVGALYWLPAVAEQTTVHLDRARWTETGGGFRGSFQWPWQLVQPTLIHDYGADVAQARPAPDRFPRVPALAALALIVGVVTGLLPRPARATAPRPAEDTATGAAGDAPPPSAAGHATDHPGPLLLRPTGLAVLVSIAAALFLAAPPAQPLWRAFPLLASVQLGWRFLAVLLVMAIPLAATLPDLPIRRSAPALALLLALAPAATSLLRLPVESIPWSAMRERPAELAFFERKTGEFALGALQEYVPRAAEATPEQLALEPADPGDASNPAVDVRLVGADPVSRSYDLASAVPATLVLDLFAQPSLSVTIDGTTVPIRAVGDDGLVAFDVPTGRHRLDLASAPTSIERAADWVSLVAAATTLLLAATALPRRLGVAAVTCLVVLLLAAVPMLPRSAQAASARALLVPPTPIPLDRARLLGAEVDPSFFPALGILAVDLHVQSLLRFHRNDSIALRLVTEQGQVVAESVGGPAGGLRPTSRWRPNQLLRLRQELRVPAALSADRYVLEAELHGVKARIGPISLPAAGSVDPPGLLDPFARFESLFGDELVLDGYTYDPAATARPLRGSFWWRRIRDGAPLYDATLRLVDKQGAILAEDTRRMGGLGALRPQADFSLLTATPPPTESYRLELLVRPLGGAPLPARTYSGSTSEALVLSWLDVPEPCGCLPVGATPLNAAFADGISLAGFSTGRGGDEVEVSLFWRADARPSRDYVVAVRLLDGDRVVAHIDDMPNGGHRPTAAWRPGEVVPDRYHLRPSSGRATAVEVALVSPANNQPLPLAPPTATNAVVLPLPGGGA